MEVRSRNDDAPESICTENEILTMAFVNFQPFGEIYDTAVAFKNGTLFPDIDKPLKVGGMKK